LFVFGCCSLFCLRQISFFHFYFSASLFFLAGIVLTNLKSEFTVTSDSIEKKTSILFFSLSNEKVRLPKNCKEVIIKKQVKTGTRYLNLVVKSNYNVTSFDMFFVYDRGVVRIINTDLERAKIFAEMIKMQIHLNYRFQ
jgi:hypothetical protein